MAIVPIHKAITKEVLDGFSFVRRAVDIAVDANAAVDQQQGDEASETNLHSMRGYFLAPDPAFGKLTIRVKQDVPRNTLSMRGLGNGVPLGTGTGTKKGSTLQLGPLELVPDPFANMSQNYRLQTEQEAKDAVDSLLRKARADVVRLVGGKDYVSAMVRLGEALHTVQDRVFHHFEPWPYKDIPDSLMKAPNYMLCHVLRDVGYISKVKVDEHQFALGVAMWVGSQSYLGADVFAPNGNQNGMSGFRGYGGLLTLSLGAPPGSLRENDRGGRESASADDVESCLATEGVADKAKATDDSKEFVKSIKREVDGKMPGKWEDFLQMKLVL